MSPGARCEAWRGGGGVWVRVEDWAGYVGVIANRYVGCANLNAYGYANLNAVGTATYVALGQAT